MWCLNKKNCLIIIFVIIIPFLTQVSGDRNEIHGSAPVTEPGIIFPLTKQAIDDEVYTSISKAEQDITSLLTIPANKRNETNTILRFEEILTRLDSSLLKYQTLAGLYPDNDLQNTAFMAAERRNGFIRNIALNNDLYRIIQETKPESDYGRWLYEQEKRFFRSGGAGLSDEEKTQLASLYPELRTLQNQYLINIRENRSLIDNLNILTKITIIRNTIASLQGYSTWTDFKADEQGWMMNSTDISSLLDEIKPLVKEQVQPVVSEVLQIKKTRDQGETVLYDYEVDSLLTLLQKTGTIHDKDFSMPFNQTISRSLSLLSCLTGVKTEFIADAHFYAPDVLLFRVTDEKTNETMGWFYLDLKERAEKTRNWMTALIAGEVNVKGSEQGPAAPVYIVSGTVYETPEKSGFNKDEYTLLFHELGHVYTQILSASRHSSQIPEIIPVELTEAASHFFEYLAWTPEILGIIMALDKPVFSLEEHNISEYYDMNGPFSSKQRWNLGKDMTIGILENQFIKTSGNISFGERYADIFTEITGVKVADHGGYLLRHPHFAEDTAGMYWIYPVGRLYGAMVYSKFFRNGFFNKTTWNEFSDLIVTPDDRSITAQERMMKFLNADNISIYKMVKEEKERSTRKIWIFIPGCITKTLPVF